MTNAAVRLFRERFGAGPDAVFRAPGRIEVCGNHLDHQRGQVIAAAVNREMAAAVRVRPDTTVRIWSEGFEPFSLDIADTAVREEEKGTSAALVRGMAAALRERGVVPGGFDACVASQVCAGSGMSSSAAFEVLTGVVLTGLFPPAEPLEMTVAAQAGQTAENRYYGKPSGLMDQMASALGGLVWMDFKDPAHPEVEQLPALPDGVPYRFCLVNTGGSHEDLTGDYVAVPREMKAVAAFFGKEVLREVAEEEVRAALPELRNAAGDRAVLRALHFYEESRNVSRCKEALLRGDVRALLGCIRKSGESSARLLQNIDARKDPARQELTLALALSGQLLRDEGAVRVHGGGFAGTILAVVPDRLLEVYRSEMERVFGTGAVNELCIGAPGAGRVE